MPTRLIDNSRLSLRALKVVTILAPAIFIGVFELLRHSLFVEEKPMAVGGLVIIAAMLLVSYFVSTYVFGKVDQMQKDSLLKSEEMAALREREEIAREMHDGLAQVLGYVNTKAQAAKRLLASGEADQALLHLEKIENAARDASADVRQTILGMRHTAASNKDMVDIIGEYLTRFAHTTGIRTMLETNGQWPRLSSFAELQITRVIQEALANVSRHAGARSACVRLAHSDGQLCVTVEDDGHGIVQNPVERGESPRFGLRFMKERAESINGTLEVSTVPEGGTRVNLTVPHEKEKIG